MVTCRGAEFDNYRMEGVLVEAEVPAGAAMGPGAGRIVETRGERYDQAMGSPMPTVLRVGRFRFFFFSNEAQEPAHIHVKSGGDEAKLWLDPVELAANAGFNGRELTQVQRLVEEHQEELLEAWNAYFSP